jgi:hypothetical protein
MSSGAFPHGAIVSGVNDIGGSSAYDVHTRLNINTNGCAFPGSAAPPRPPSQSQNPSTPTPVNEAPPPPPAPAPEPTAPAPAPAPAPADTTVLTAPTRPVAHCNGDGTFTVSWDSLPGAQSYYLRVDYRANNDGDNWYMGGEDYYLDEYGDQSFTAPVIPNQPYSWWVHGANSTVGIGRAAEGSITCSQ